MTLAQMGGMVAAVRYPVWPVIDRGGMPVTNRACFLALLDFEPSFSGFWLSERRTPIWMSSKGTLS